MQRAGRAIEHSPLRAKGAVGYIIIKKEPPPEVIAKVKWLLLQRFFGYHPYGDRKEKFHVKCRSDSVWFYLTTENTKGTKRKWVALHCEGNEEQTPVDCPSGNRCFLNTFWIKFCFSQQNCVPFRSLGASYYISHSNWVEKVLVF